ncbi:MAG: hypothetical protein M1819_004312 [Sarea resinae]|nr:MAG: hypothetical protein M1819_004312 [Sarea resinae]
MPKFVPRQRKHKARQRQSQNGSATISAVADSNAAEILPASKSEKEERRRQLREELRAQQSKVSSKKQKRLEKYIDKKLQKEENLELIKKLAQTRVDTSLFRSTKSLGANKESRREAVARALKEKEAGIDAGESDEILLRHQQRQTDDPDGISEDDEVLGTEEPEEPALASTAQPSLGSGLKRPLEVGEDGMPVIKKRKRKATMKAPRFEVSDEVEWEGFGLESDDDVDSGPEEGSQSSAISSEDELDNDSSPSEASDETDGEEDVEETSRLQERTSAFKSWATQRRNEALGFVPSADTLPEPVSLKSGKPIEFKPREPEQEPLPAELQTVTATDTTRKAYSVPVERSPEIQEARLQLPVVAEEQKIMEAIHNNPSVVIWGATGSGKTTQVPQFLYEAGYGSPNSPTPGMIGVTQPRRVAAVSMAKRVGDELGGSKGKVSYQIRFETTVSDKTAIKFMTDGVLLREIAHDFALTKYSAIIIDEAHERSVNTDILIGMMSRIVDLRAEMAQSDPTVKPLKLIIMSATLRISDFTENRNLFRKGPPPLLQAEGRQYPVSTHFARKTNRDYLEETFKKVSRGHQKLPPGGMLVFLTGQNEIKALSKRLKQSLASTQGSDVKGPSVRISAREAPLETEDMELGDFDRNVGNGYNSESETEITGLEEDGDDEFNIGEDEESGAALKIHVLPLYSQLPTNEQLRVFEPPPDGSRLIVLATNVAETSLTIPGIRYVFDCGRSKEKKYDRTTGVQSFEVGWISKASASQRSGRAGRTGPGHCYRLYSSAVFERDFDEYAEPEILRTPIEGVVLQLKSMDLQHVINFPFPTPPDRTSLVKAERLLTYLGALSSDGGKITSTGRTLSTYPLSPRFSKMLALAHHHNCTAYAIALVAALAVPDLLIPENQLDLRPPQPETRTNDDDDDDEPVRHLWTESDNLAASARAQRQKSYNKAHAALGAQDPSSDALKLFTAICAAAHAPDADAFAASMFLRPKALHEAEQLRRQLHDIVRANTAITGTTTAAAAGPYQARLPQPSKTHLAVLKQLLVAGFIDHVALRADLAPNPPESYRRKPTRAIDVPYLTLFPSHDPARRRHPSTSKTDADDEDDDDPSVYIHPASVLARTPPKELPQYLIYSHLQRSSPSAVTGAKKPRVRMHALVPATASQLVRLAMGTPLLRWGHPIGKAGESVFRLVASDADADGDGNGEGEMAAAKKTPTTRVEEREVWRVPSLVGHSGAGVGWPLGARKVVQRKTRAGAWEVVRLVA